jgi:hypothetical protein
LERIVRPLDKAQKAKSQPDQHSLVACHHRQHLNSSQISERLPGHAGPRNAGEEPDTYADFIRRLACEKSRDSSGGSLT